MTVHLTVLYPLFLYSGEIWNIWKLFPKCLPYGAQMKVSRYVYLEIQRLLAALIQHSAVAPPIPKLSQGRTIRFTWTSWNNNINSWNYSNAVLLLKPSKILCPHFSLVSLVMTVTTEREQYCNSEQTDEDSAPAKVRNMKRRSWIPGYRLLRGKV